MKNKRLVPCRFSHGLWCVLIGMMMPWNSYASGTVSIALDVDIAPSLAKPWTETQLTSLRSELLRDLEGALQSQEQLAFWNFVRREPNTHPGIVLTLAVAEDGPDKFTHELQLFKLKDGPGDANVPSYHLPKILDRKPLLDPVDLMFGLPGPSAILAKCKPLLQNAFVKNEELKAEINGRLTGSIPLAIGPVWSPQHDRAFVLPLSKNRYISLRWSVFRVRSGSGPPQNRNLVAVAEDVWDKYDDDMAVALLARIRDTAENRDPNTFEPNVVFLHEYIPDDDWDTLD